LSRASSRKSLYQTTRESVCVISLSLSTLLHYS
jgi:hypothetical protein